MRYFQVVFLTGLGLLLAGSNSVADQRPAEGARCAQIDNDIARLQCFDEVYADYIESANAPGEWEIKTTRDPIDDKVTTYLAVEASEKSSALQTFNSNQLLIRCMGNDLDVYIHWGKVMGGEVPFNVTHRVGGNKARTQTWASSTDGTATFFPGNTLRLVRQMMEADRFVAQIPLKNFQATKMTAIFDISGLKDAAAPMSKACLPTLPEDPKERRIQELILEMEDRQSTEY